MGTSQTCSGQVLERGRAPVEVLPIRPHLCHSIAGMVVNGVDPWSREEDDL